MIRCDFSLRERKHDVGFIYGLFYNLEGMTILIGRELCIILGDWGQSWNWSWLKAF